MGIPVRGNLRAMVVKADKMSKGRLQVSCEIKNCVSGSHSPKLYKDLQRIIQGGCRNARVGGGKPERKSLTYKKTGGLFRVR